MRKHFVTNLLLGFILFFAQSATIISTPEVQAITETDTINLRGEFRTGGLRSGGDVITAEIQDGVIQALFHMDVGNLLIAVTDESGNTVYETTVSTPVQQQLLIPLAGLSSGTYTITFSNGRGEMRGEFEIHE